MYEYLRSHTGDDGDVTTLHHDDDDNDDDDDEIMYQWNDYIPGSSLPKDMMTLA